MSDRALACDGYRYVDCGTATNLTLDHIIPLARHTAAKRRWHDDELQTLCLACNSLKGTG